MRYLAKTDDHHHQLEGDRRELQLEVRDMKIEQEERKAEILLQDEIIKNYEVVIFELSRQLSKLKTLQANSPEGG